MLIWLLIAIVLALLGVVEIILGFSLPFLPFRTAILLLLVLGMSYRIYLMEKVSEKERMKERIRELEDKLREKEMTGK